MAASQYKINSTTPPYQHDDNVKEWELLEKHILILTSSGKPVFTRHGDEQDLSPTFGLIQAVISIVKDSGDDIRCIQAGRRKIVFFVRNYLYFVCISSTGESEFILQKQLRFLHHQMLFFLTSKVDDVLCNNIGKDIRDLLGQDASRLMLASCSDDDLAPIPVAFDAIKACLCDESVKSVFNSALRACVESSAAALGIIVFGDSLVAYCVNSESGLYLSVSDIGLLVHFLNSSGAIRSHEQNWAPLCLPDFNAGAFLQAYICDLKLSVTPANVSVPSAEQGPTTPPHEVEQQQQEQHQQVQGQGQERGQGQTQTQKQPTSDSTTSAPSPPQISMLLISASADASAFKELHEARQTLENSLSAQFTNALLQEQVQSRQVKLLDYAEAVNCKYFLCIHRPSCELPPQYVISDVRHTFDQKTALKRLLPVYSSMYICTHNGSSLAEYSLIEPYEKRSINNKKNKNGDKEQAENDLSYIVLGTGETVVALKIGATELFATFPVTMSSKDACDNAGALLKRLEELRDRLFLAF